VTGASENTKLEARDSKIEGRPESRISSSADGFDFRRLLVVGCGNPLAGDDSAGVEIVGRLEKRSSPADRDQFRTVRSAGVELLETFSAAGVVLFIDAVSSGAPPCDPEPAAGGSTSRGPTGGGPPGTLHLVPLPAGNIEPRSLRSLSSHGWGLAETLDLARTLGRHVPKLMLLGVEVGEVSPGAVRSPAVEQAITLLVEQFPRLQSLLLDLSSPLWRGCRRFPPGGNAFLEGLAA
jgi:hydrogenase maturation protease